MAPLLEIKDLHVAFTTDAGTVQAVDGVSYSVDLGETLAIVGESGCGKSVSALSVMGLLPHPAGKVLGGEILFDGTNLLDVSNLDMRHIRGKEVAMVFQEPMTSLNPLLTIGRQLTEGLELHMNMSSKQAHARAVELLELVEITDGPRRLNQYPHHLSGGMRQRVMLALALSCEPRLIIADEPTTALDVTIQAQILELMKKITDESGMALIIITHNLGIVARYADTVNIMYAGRIVEGGTADEIYASPRHPYTRGLMRSVPRPDAPRTAKLEPIEGQPPDLMDLPPGCSFEPRCPHATDQCRMEAPPLRQATPGHTTACWLMDELEPAATVVSQLT